jgi:hypothetical protein
MDGGRPSDGGDPSLPIARHGSSSDYARGCSCAKQTTRMSADRAPECLGVRQDAVLELTLPLPTRQFRALEEQALILGLTTGQLLRRVIHNWLRGFPPLVPEQPLCANATAHVSQYRDA